MDYSAILAADANENIEITDSVVQLTLPAYYSSTGIISGRCRIQVRTAAILFTPTGNAPTASNEATGEKANVGDVIILDTLVEMKNLNMVRATGTNAAVFVTYEKLI